MRQIPFAGEIHTASYPSMSTNAEYLPDGSVRGLPAPQVAVSLAGVGRGFVNYNGAWYIVQGTTLYHWSGSGSPTAIATNLPATGSVYFVSLTQCLVMVISGGGIWKIVGTTATKITAPSDAPSVPNRERVYYEFNLNQDYGGSATYSSSGGTFTLSDVNDGEPGAHRFLGSSNLATTPKQVRDITVELASWSDGVSLRHSCVLQLYRNISSATNRAPVEGASVEIPYPYRVGTHTIQGVWDMDSGTGFRFHIRHNTVWLKRVRCLNAIEATHYALTTVSGGVESKPVYFTVDTANSAGTVGQYWFVKFTSLPSGTWRLYRRDSAGVYRLVHEGTGSTYTDYKSDSELGDRLLMDSLPALADIAIGWNRRCVLAKGSKLYITDAGSLSITDDGDVVDVQQEVIGLAVVRGQLYFATRDGWYVVFGWKDTITVSKVSSDVPLDGYVGDMLATQVYPAGAYFQGGVPDRQLSVRLVYATYDKDRLYYLSDTGEVYIRYPTGQWTRLAGTYRSFVVYDGVLWLQDDSGLVRLVGSPQTLVIEWTLAFERPTQMYQIWLEGDGVATLKVRDRTGAWRTASGTLPLELDRIDHPYYTLTVSVSGTRLYRLLIEAEERKQLSKRR